MKKKYIILARKTNEYLKNTVDNFEMDYTTDIEDAFQFTSKKKAGEDIKNRAWNGFFQIIPVYVN